MANPQYQAAAGKTKLLTDGGVDFDVQSFLVEIALRFLYILEGIAIIIAGILAIRYAKSYFQKVQVAHESQRMALNLIEKLASGFLAVVTVTLALKVIGLDLTLLISSVALGLSFGLKDIIKNYISGILILFKSPFAIGDIVKIKSFLGKVERIDFQSTTLKTFDRKEVTIYNKDILSQSITNFSKEPIRRLEIEIPLGRGTDMAHALSVFEVILHQHPRVLKNPKASMVFKNFNDEGVKISIRFWVQQPINILQIRSEIALQLERAFDEEKIVSAYSRSIQFTSDFSMHEDRKHRLQVFYGMPVLGNIAEKTASSLEAVFSQPELPEVVDKEEPDFTD